MGSISTRIGHVLQLAKNVFTPSISLIGVYPLSQTEHILRFGVQTLETKRNAQLQLKVFVDNREKTDCCITLNDTTIARRGIRFRTTSYSLAFPSNAGTISLALCRANERFAVSLDLGRNEISDSLRKFENLTRDAAHDPAYPYNSLRTADSGDLSIAPVDEVSIIVAGQNAGCERMLDTIESIANQTHPSWNITYIPSSVDAAETQAIIDQLNDSRILCASSSDDSFVSKANRAIHDSQATVLLFLKEGDTLAPHALERFASAQHQSRKWLAYSDSDTISADAQRFSNPQFRPHFNRDLLYSENYIGHVFAVSNEVLAAMGDDVISLDEGWSYELLLKASEDSEIIHLPEVLYHAYDNGQSAKGDRNRIIEIEEQETRALKAHLNRRNITATIQKTSTPGVYRTLYTMCGSQPSVSIVIPNKDHVDYLQPCIESIQAKAGYSNYEIVVVENNSVDKETFDFYDSVEALYKNVRVVPFDGPFNYSAIINRGVRKTSSDIVLLLNNDTSVITDDFLPKLAGYLTRDEVGVVAPRLLYPDGLVQHAGMVLLASHRMGFVNQNLSPKLTGGYLNTLACSSNCSAVLGACQMMRRETFDAVGGYLEDLAVTCNDIDFCWKVHALGLDVVYTPHVELYHKEFGSRNNDNASREQEAQSTREYERMVRNWPEQYTYGDGFINPNLNPNSMYHQLRSVGQ